MLKKLNTLKVKFPVITFFTYFFLIAVVLLACYFRFYQNMVATYTRLAEETLNLAVHDINIDHIPGYLAGKFGTEYKVTAEKLNRYPVYNPEIYYLYAYRINEDEETATVIFDAKTKAEDYDKLGDLYELEPDIVANMDALKQGQPIDPLTDNTKYGYLLTVSKPLIDSKGDCQGYIFVDFNLTEVREANRSFIFRLFILVFFLMLVVLYMGMKTVAVRITEPIEKMYLCLSEFSYDTDEERKNNIQKMRDLNIHTNPEIQSLYNALIASAQDSYVYMREIRNASEKLDEANEMAFLDGLTGFGNKNAYESKLAEYHEKISRHVPIELSVIMVDVNNLKYVNDTFGHEKGDDYIQGCCRVISEFCKNSFLYRIGGDEFVVLLNGSDYANRKKIFAAIQMMYDTTYTDEAREPWERYSASVGMADFLPHDRNLIEVFKRADAAMYQAKQRFKEKHGSYR